MPASFLVESRRPTCILRHRNLGGHSLTISVNFLLLCMQPKWLAYTTEQVALKELDETSLLVKVAELHPCRRIIFGSPFRSTCLRYQAPLSRIPSICVHH